MPTPEQRAREEIDSALDAAGRHVQDAKVPNLAWILEELASERRWAKSLSRSEDALAGLADEALQDRRAGRTRPLDLKQL